MMMNITIVPDDLIPSPIIHDDRDVGDWQRLRDWFQANGDPSFWRNQLREFAGVVMGVSAREATRRLRFLDLEDRS